MTTTAGTHSFTCFTSLPNATTDGNSANDQTVSTFNVVPGGQALPVQEGLEVAAFPPAGWTLDNPDASVTWARTTNAAKTGAASMWFNSINYPCNGCIDILQTPNLDLSSMVSPQITFQVAYRMLSDPSLNPSWSDSLRVDISTNCGNTWTNLYFKYSTNLTTITPSFSTTPFVPGANDWRLETIPLTAYASQSNVIFRWKVSSDYENNLYVDDINITGAVGVNEQSLNNYIALYPNPANDFFYVHLGATNLGPVSILVYNLVGELVSEISDNISLPKRYKINSSSLDGGLYFVEVKASEGSAVKKVLLTK